MEVPKPTDDDKSKFRSLVPDEPGVEVKAMFGNLGAFVNGHMFLGLFGTDVGVKLPEEDRLRLLEEPGAGPYGPPERPMGGWVTLPAAWSASQAEPWIHTALAYIGSLPPKAAKKPKSTRKTP